MSLLSIIVTAVTTILTVGIVGILKAVYAYRTTRRKQTDDLALAVVTKYENRMEALEIKLSEAEAQFHTDLASERLRCDSELSIVRHSVKDWKQVSYSLLNLFVVPENRRMKLIELVRKEMEALETASALERGAMLGVDIQESNVRT